MTYRCPDCGAETRILATREEKLRRRICLGPAAHRFTTCEIHADVIPVGMLLHEALAPFRKYVLERVLNDRENSYKRYLPRV